MHHKILSNTESIFLTLNDWNKKITWFSDGIGIDKIGSMRLSNAPKNILDNISSLFMAALIAAEFVGLTQAQDGADLDPDLGNLNDDNAGQNNNGESTFILIYSNRNSQGITYNSYYFDAPETNTTYTFDINPSFAPYFQTVPSTIPVNCRIDALTQDPSVNYKLVQQWSDFTSTNIARLWCDGKINKSVESCIEGIVQNVVTKMNQETGMIIAAIGGGIAGICLLMGATKLIINLINKDACKIPSCTASPHKTETVCDATEEQKTENATIIEMDKIAKLSR